MNDLTGNMSRLRFLEDQVAHAKKSLRHWEDMKTHELCLMNGQHYPLPVDIVDKGS